MPDIQHPAREALAPLRTLARDTDFTVDYVGTVYRRGWWTRSTRPWHLYAYGTGKFLAAYTTADALEAALRARLGC